MGTIGSLKTFSALFSIPAVLAGLSGHWVICGISSALSLLTLVWYIQEIRRVEKEASQKTRGDGNG